MRSKLLWLMTWLLLTTLPQASASADELDYRATIEGAVEAYSQQRYDEALGLFLKAHALSPSARTLRGIGLASFETRRYVDSIRSLTDALQDSRSSLTPAMRSEAERVIRAASPFVVHLELAVQPAEAELSVDGQVLARDRQHPVLLDPGPHQLVAKAKGYQPAARSVQWPPGTHTNLELRMIPEVPAAVANAVSESDTRADEQTTPSAEAPRRKRRSRFGVLKWVALGTTVATLATMGVAIGLREDRARAISRVCTGELSTRDRQTCNEWRDNGQAWKVASIATGVLAGALTATTIVLFVTDRPRDSDAPRARRSCQIGLGAQQVRCQVQF